MQSNTRQSEKYIEFSVQIYMMNVNVIIISKIKYIYNKIRYCKMKLKIKSYQNFNSLYAFTLIIFIKMLFLVNMCNFSYIITYNKT